MVLLSATWPETMADMENEQTVELLREIRDLHAQQVENQALALEQQGKALEVQARAVRVQRIALLTVLIAVVLALLFVFFVSRH